MTTIDSEKAERRLRDCSDSDLCVLSIFQGTSNQGDISVPSMFCALMQAFRSSEVSGGLERRLMRRCCVVSWELVRVSLVFLFSSDSHKSLSLEMKNLKGS